ncbi:PKD domain-containing protein [Chromobacterium sp. ASV23]|uniref:M30 family zinc metallopeptidase n=1 Tax=Chromobacterium sp. ASV23 TaxID=2795110 RepID=UPI001E2D8688|nr:PKD domain-containing protein [Chromobacterium sp. ASV23]
MEKMNKNARMQVMAACIASALMLSACGGGGGGGGDTSPGTQTTRQTAPSTPNISIGTTGSLLATAPIAFSASATDPSGLTLSYIWDFGDGSAPTPGQNVSHTYAKSGSYTVKVTVSNTANQASSFTQSITIVAPNPATPTIQSSATTAAIGQSVTFTANSSDPQNLPLTFSWDFGDGSAGSGATVSHTFNKAGTYNVSVTASDTSGLQATASIAQGVVATNSNKLVADCAGANCGAVDASTYSGNGIGTWRYTNTTSSDATIDINIAGVKPGNKATLVFTNGGTNMTSAPGTGNLASASALPSLGARAVITHEMMAYQGTYAGKMAMTEKNRQLAEQLIHLPAQTVAARAQAARMSARSRANAAIGDTRTWNDLWDNASNPVPYVTQANTQCTLPSGRNVVFWLDPNATKSGNVSSDDMAAMKNAVCGSNGGFAQLNALLGDVWGTVPSKYTGSVIQDSPGALQDINIAIVNAPASTGWAGYFYGANNYLSSVSGMSNSNQALLFFINAGEVKNNRNYTIASLLHEATHMTNFYQRSIVRGTTHDTWLEETSAMLSEDVIAPALLGGYDTAYSVRIPGYLQTGGGVSYNQWSTLSSGSYSLGGAFGAFLNRRYGLAIYKQLITSCNDGDSYGIDSSYNCLDKLITSNGGSGLADEYARFGASIFATLPATNLPNGYGFPTKTDGAYQFAAFDLTKYQTTSPQSLFGIFQSMSHSYQVDNINGNSYSRKGVKIPANTSMILVVR